MKNFNLSDGYVFPEDWKVSVEQEESIYHMIKEELDRQGISRNQYSLGIPDGSSDGCVCFHAEGEMWVCYVSERGSRYGVTLFSSISDGMNFLVWTFLCSPEKRNSDVGFLPLVGVINKYDY